MSRFKTLFHILAVVSLCMNILAHLSPVWASENGLFEIQICSGTTYKTITIDENGEEVPAKPKLRTQICAFCSASAFTAVETNLPFQLPEKESLTDPHVFVVGSVPAFNTKQRAHPTRAPPATS